MGPDTADGILEAANRLFLQYGYKRTTVDDIARDAGVSKGSIYLHFSSKEQILQMLSRQQETLVLDRIRAAAAGDAPAPKRLQEAVAAAFLTIWDLCHEAPHAPDIWAENLAAIGGDHHLDAKRTADRILAEVIADGQRDGAFSAELDPLETARLIRLGASAFNAPYLESELETREQIEQTLPQVVDLMIRGLSPAGRESIQETRE